MSRHRRTYWLNLTDSREAVITIHNLNGNQPACPAWGCCDLKVFSGDRAAGARDEHVLNPNTGAHTHTHRRRIHMHISKRTYVSSLAADFHVNKHSNKTLFSFNIVAEWSCPCLAMTCFTCTHSHPITQYKLH